MGNLASFIWIPRMLEWIEKTGAPIFTPHTGLSTARPEDFVFTLLNTVIPPPMCRSTFLRRRAETGEVDFSFARSRGMQGNIIPLGAAPLPVFDKQTAGPMIFRPAEPDSVFK